MSARLPSLFLAVFLFFSFAKNIECNMHSTSRRSRLVSHDARLNVSDLLVRLKWDTWCVRRRLTESDALCKKHLTAWFGSIFTAYTFCEQLMKRVRRASLTSCMWHAKSRSSASFYRPGSARIMLVFCSRFASILLEFCSDFPHDVKNRAWR